MLITLLTGDLGELREKDVFGEDAQTFNPDRWLDPSLKGKRNSSVGVYANLYVTHPLPPPPSP